MMGLNVSVLALVWANDILPVWIKIILTIFLGIDWFIMFTSDNSSENG